MNIIRCVNGKQDGIFLILDEKWMIDTWMLEE
jgi:hypothetical protein